MKERRKKIMDAFQSLGFKLEKREDFGYEFDYEKYNYLWMPSETDEDFMSIAIPAVLEKSDIDEHIFYRLINHLNCTQKYIKAISLSDRMWILYERELIDEDDRLEHVISEMITSLESAILNLYNSIQESESSTDEDVESNTDEKSDSKDNESDCIDSQNEQDNINE